MVVADFWRSGGGFYFFMQAWKRDKRVQVIMDRLLKLPIFGVLVEKSCIARWTRTLSTMFAAGVPPWSKRWIPWAAPW